jgi:hypothetical protein
MCEVCETAKFAVPALVALSPWLKSWWCRWRAWRFARRQAARRPPACPLCGPVPKGVPIALCYPHYEQNYSYSKLFLEPLEPQKEREAQAPRQE